MKNLFLGLLTFFSIHTAKGQFYFEFGPRAGMWLNTSGINSIIKDYNDTRSWLSDPMPKVHFGNSYRFSIGTQGHEGKPGYSFTLQALRSTPTAHGTEPSTGNEGYRKVLFHYGGFGFGMNGNLSDDDDADLLVGGDFMFNYVALRTWYANNPEFREAQETEIGNPMTLGVQFYCRASYFLGPVGLGITPYIELPIMKQETYKLGNELNGGHTSENTVWWPASIGASVTLVVCPKHGD
jgi:hypothetical protein